MWLLLLSFFVSCAVGSSWFSGGKESIQEELGPRLSQSAKIIVKGEDEFKGATARWQYWEAPHVNAVVEVQNEEDVIQTVLYATKHNISFFPTVGGAGHGTINSLAKARNSIQITLRALNSIVVSEDGTYATVGGGIKGVELVEALWKEKKQTVTGCCECVGLTGVALGGGHGVLQGYYGLLSDQMLEVNLVLANGTAITVSDSEHADLFWALQGAGHNFGIVTSMKYKIYDVDFDNGKNVWSYEVFTYPATEENIRAVYTQAKKLMGSQPEGMFLYGLVLTNPFIADEPVIMKHVIWNGPLSAIREYTQAFHDLNPISVSAEEGEFPDVAKYLQVDKDSMVCHAQEYVPGPGIPRFPVDMKEYNIEAVVDAVEKFRELTMSVKELAGSFLIIEQYSTQGLKKRSLESSAVITREDKLLVAPALFYSSVNLDEGVPINKTFDKFAVERGLEIKDILVEGAKKNGGTRAYVNYAYGGETLEEI